VAIISFVVGLKSTNGMR